MRLPTLAGLIALLVAVSGAMIWGIGSFANSAAWVGHTYEVFSKIEAVRAAVREVESAARGYRLTSDQGLLAEYQSSVGRVAQRVSALSELVRDNPVQARRARQLETLTRSRLAEIKDNVTLYAAGRSTEALERMDSGLGVRLMEDIDRLCDEMRREEELLLGDRRVATSRKAGMLTAFVVAGMLLSLGMLAVLIRQLSQENRRALGLERESREALEAVQVAMAQRELLGEQRRVLGAFAGLLHSCQTVEESLDVSANALAQLLPHGIGVCYLMRASQNLLELRPMFGTHGAGYGDVMRPDQCWGLRRGHMHVYDPRRPTAACGHLRDLPGDAVHGVCMPLSAQGEVLGLLHVSNSVGGSLTDNERAAVEAVAEHLAVVLHSLQLRESLRVQSLRDPLTGLYNRRYLEESLQREMERCARRERPLSVLMLDIDHFKRFNDEHGHGAGDALLTRVGEVLRTLTRGEDIACRYGGEEFTVVMPEADSAQAEARAEQIRQAVAESTIVYMRRELGPVTVSIGVAEQQADGRETTQSLVASADRALYSAKAHGRNRVLRAGASVTA